MLIQVRNSQFNIEDRGSGSPILLIHGFPLNLEMWRSQIDAFSNQYRVIAFDLRGFGHSPPTPGPYSMELLADDCAAVLAELGIPGPAVICGLSMGGYISFALYRRQPQLFSALILAATRAGADSNQARANRDKAIQNTIEHGPQPVIDSMLKILLAPNNYLAKPDLVEALEKILSVSTPVGMVAALEGMKTRPDSTPILNQIKVPTLIFQGADDQIIAAGEAEILDSEIPDSKLVMVPDAGHMLNMEQPEIFNHEVARFLDSI